MVGISQIALNNTVYDIEDKEVRNTISTNPSLEENLSEDMYAWTNSSTTYFTKESTPTINSTLYTSEESNVFNVASTFAIVSVNSNSITIKENKDYQAWTYNGNTYYTLGENPQVGDDLYIKDGDNFVTTSLVEITAVSNNSITIESTLKTLTFNVSPNVYNLSRLSVNERTYYGGSHGDNDFDNDTSLTLEFEKGANISWSALGMTTTSYIYTPTPSSGSFILNSDTTVNITITEEANSGSGGSMH